MKEGTPFLLSTIDGTNKELDGHLSSLLEITYPDFQTTWPVSTSTHTTYLHLTMTEDKISVSKLLSLNVWVLLGDPIVEIIVHKRPTDAVKDFQNLQSNPRDSLPN